MKSAFLLCCMLLTILSNAQTDSTQAASDPPIIDDREFICVLHPMPEFPGGQDSLYAFLKLNTEYPPRLLADSVEGKVYIQFTINETGAIEDPEVMYSDDDLFSEEAIRVVELMPNWTPGTQGGQPVKVRFTLPFFFKLDED